MDQGIHRVVRNVRAALEAMGIHISKVIMFGSCVQGKRNEHGDIDLAVISDDFENMNLLQRFELAGGALSKARIMDPVEIRGYTEKEFESQQAGTFAGDEIKTKGIEVS